MVVSFEIRSGQGSGSVFANICRWSLPSTQGLYIKGLVTLDNIVYFRFKATSLAPPGDAGVRSVFGRKNAW